MTAPVIKPEDITDEMVERAYSWSPKGSGVQRWQIRDMLTAALLPTDRRVGSADRRRAIWNINARLSYLFNRRAIGCPGRRANDVCWWDIQKVEPEPEPEIVVTEEMMQIGLRTFYNDVSGEAWTSKKRMNEIASAYRAMRKLEPKGDK